MFGDPRRGIVSNDAVYQPIRPTANFILTEPRQATANLANGKNVQTIRRQHSTIARSIFDVVSKGVSLLSAVDPLLIETGVGEGLMGLDLALQGIGTAIGNRGEKGEVIPTRQKVKEHPFVRNSKIGKLVEKFVYDEITTNDLSPSMRIKVNEALESPEGKEFEKFLHGNANKQSNATKAK